jgi:hypothetical protein
MTARALLALPAGACFSAPGDTMHPQDGDHNAIHKAKTICTWCPLATAAECLRQALADPESDGIRGALTAPERAHVRRGGRIRRCNTCGIPFVPAHDATERCARCNYAKTAAKTQRQTVAAKIRLAPHRMAITRWAAEGRTDPDIARNIGVPVKAIRAARRAWGVAPGYHRDRNVGGRRGGKRDGAGPVDHAAVHRVASSEGEFVHLNDASRVELWHRFLADGGRSSTEFGRRYRVRGSEVKRIRELAQAQQPQSTQPDHRLAA